MKRNIASAFSGLSIIAFFCLSSFSGKMGGDKFEIYINGKLVVEQFVAAKNSVPTIELGKYSSNQKMEVYYSHCGKTGTGRTITISNAQNQVLKQWQFADAAAQSAMSCQLKDILPLQKNKEEKLNLYYSSKELPGGRLLAVVTSSGEKTAALTTTASGDLETMITRSTLPCASVPGLN